MGVLIFLHKGSILAEYMTLSTFSRHFEYFLLYNCQCWECCLVFMHNRSMFRPISEMVANPVLIWASASDCSPGQSVVCYRWVSLCLFREVSPLLTWIQFAGSSGQIEILQCWVKLQRAWGFFGAVYIVRIDNLFYFLYVCVCVCAHTYICVCMCVCVGVCMLRPEVSVRHSLIVFYLICWGRVSHLNPELPVSPMLFSGPWPRTLWRDLLAGLSQGTLFTSWVLFSHLSWVLSSATPLGNAFNSFMTGKRLPCSRLGLEVGHHSCPVLPGCLHGCLCGCWGS